jgi:hypothetical protein
MVKALLTNEGFENIPEGYARGARTWLIRLAEQSHRDRFEYP